MTLSKQSVVVDAINSFSVFYTPKPQCLIQSNKLFAPNSRQKCPVNYFMSNENGNTLIRQNCLQSFTKPGKNADISKYVKVRRHKHNYINRRKTKCVYIRIRMTLFKKKTMRKNKLCCQTSARFVIINDIRTRKTLLASMGRQIFYIYYINWVFALLLFCIN